MLSLRLIIILLTNNYEIFMYLYLFKTKLLSGSNQTPIREVCLGSITDLKSQFSYSNTYKGFEVNGKKYDLIVNLSHDKTILFSKTVEEWKQFFSSLEQNPTLTESIIHDGDIFNLCFINATQHEILGRRRVRLYGCSFSPKTEAYVDIVVKSSYATTSVRTPLLKSSEIQLTDEEKQKIQKSISHLKSSHCILDYLSKPYLSSSKTFKEDSTEISISKTNLKVGMLKKDD